MSKQGSQFEAQLRAFVDSAGVAALLVVAMDDKEVRSWYWGPGDFAGRMGANAACCGYEAFAKAADKEAGICDMQAAEVVVDGLASERAKRALMNEARRLRGLAEQHRALSKEIGESYHVVEE